jgi:tRNA-dihydrouridine synthase A
MSQLISVAPMMDYTDRHDRYFLRLIAPHVWLYTEMLTVQALCKGDAKRLLQYQPMEKPLVLQLGGSDPKMLAYGAALAEQAGFNEINLNVGCPSKRVKKGQFGACLMLTPALVAQCICAMQTSVTIPVTVKCRIGVDLHDSYQALYDFVQLVSQAGCQTFIIHARKAWLSGLNPKQNRSIPPLDYSCVWRIKSDFPRLKIIINGGIKTIDDIKLQLQHVDGVMIGREAYSNPYLLNAIEKAYYPSNNELLNREQIIAAYIPYIEQQLAQNVKLSQMTRHLLGLYQGEIAAKAWRRYLSENASKKDAGSDVLLRALTHRQDKICSLGF